MTLVNDIFFDTIKPLAFIVFDFETLTAYAKNLDAIELGAVKIELEAMIVHGEKFEHFIRPQNIDDFNEFAIQLTGITPDDVRDAKLRSEVLNLFEKYCEKYNCILVAQNANFDLSIIKKNMSEDSALLSYPCLDLIKLARFVYPGQRAYNLDALAGYFGVELDGRRHRALFDSELTAEILIKVLEKLDENGVDHLSEIVRIGKINKFTPNNQVGLFQ